MNYKLIEKLKESVGTDGIFSARAAISPLFLMVMWQEGKNKLSTFCITKDRDTCIAVNEKNYVAIALDKFKDYFNGILTINDLETEYYSWESDTKKLYDNLSKIDLQSLTDSELLKYFHSVNEVFLELARRTIYIENVDYEKILSIVGPEHKKQLDNIWAKATEAVFISFEARRLKKIIDIISSNSTNKIREARFIYTDYFWTKSDEDISKELGTIESNLEIKKKEFESANAISLEKMKEHLAWLDTLDPESKKIAEYLQLVMHMRDIRKDPIAQIQAMLSALSVVALKRSDINQVSAPYVLLYEYLKGIDYLKSKKTDIEGRKDGCIYMANPDLTFATEHCDFSLAMQQFEDLTKHELLNSDFLKGQTACKGRVVGKVKVIFDPHNDKNFSDGDILVTSMTRPEFVPIMKKAGAVVTNEGGITCHAAIVSRELNIPCIIGTKIATQLLKDEDMVEVDANNGVVRILKK